MRFLKLWLRVVVLGGILLAGRGASAAPVTCSYGYQDSTCGTNLYNAPQAAPTCAVTAGWTTTVAARWIGSQYSTPQCNYQPPPSCLTGWVQVVAPSWNGATWVGQVCQIPNAPSPGVCPYGFASGPAWNGSTWVYSCKSAPVGNVTIYNGDYWCTSQANPSGPLVFWIVDGVTQITTSSGSVYYFHTYQVAGQGAMNPDQYAAMLLANPNYSGQQLMRMPQLDQSGMPAFTYTYGCMADDGT